MLEIGSLVDGKYKILNKVGQGGMSVVYLAMNEKANKQWAVKEVRKDGIKDFEVLVMGHNVDEADSNNVNALIADMPEKTFLQFLKKQKTGKTQKNLPDKTKRQHLAMLSHYNILSIDAKSITS